MNFYKLLQPFLFKLNTETAHKLSLKLLNLTPTFCFPIIKSKPIKLMGLTFPNRIGLAAGLDKNADHIDGLAKLGFGFIEVGTVTPVAQIGNPLPRLFRVPEAKAIINRMGFNNKGIDYLIEQVKQHSYNGVLGINIGKNKDTPLSNAIDDYRIGLEKAYPYADYITINISSPNTPGLRELQGEAFLTDLISQLKQQQHVCQDKYNKYVPLVVKIAPDLSDVELQLMADVCLHYHIDGIIAGNTTIDHSAVAQYPHGEEQGGVSGAPLTRTSTKIISKLRAMVGADMPIIGVGGIMSGQDAVNKLNAGANLLQVYSGLIYRGPGLVQEIANII